MLAEYPEERWPDEEWFDDADDVFDDEPSRDLGAELLRTLRGPAHVTSQPVAPAPAPVVQHVAVSGHTSIPTVLCEQCGDPAPVGTACPRCGRMNFGVRR